MACNGDITQVAGVAVSGPVAVVTCSSIGADVSGSAATAQSNAESFATSAIKGGLEWRALGIKW